MIFLTTTFSIYRFEILTSKPYLQNPSKDRTSMEGGQIRVAPSYCVWSVFSTLCCCLPVGLCALYYSSKVNTANGAGDIDAATNASKTAICLNVLSLISGLICIAIFLAVEFQKKPLP
ncbi:hypothetical protein XENOCAPTIV_010806 [Xenoophorus captivus]|uniref:Uncharacterized protein n=1 Tax=Xenoophorus captivus TaxID=1517983 RepID=A0ABV0Q991_9TELE